MSIYGIIYKITNKENGHAYIGQTTGKLKNRWKCHVNFAKISKYRSPLLNAIKTQGEEGFTLEVLQECCNRDELNSAEIKWIAELRTRVPGGYNILEGGEGKKHTDPSTIEKLKVRFRKHLYNGQLVSVRQLHILSGTKLTYQVVNKRIRAGYSPYDAINENSEQMTIIRSENCRKHKRTIKYRGQLYTAQELLSNFPHDPDLKKNTLLARLKSGYTVDEALVAKFGSSLISN